MQASQRGVLQPTTWPEDGPTARAERDATAAARAQAARAALPNPAECSAGRGQRSPHRRSQLCARASGERARKLAGPVRNGREQRALSDATAASRTSAARSAPLKPAVRALAPRPARSTPGASGVRRVSARRMSARPPGGGSGTYSTLSRRPGLRRRGQVQVLRGGPAGRHTAWHGKACAGRPNFGTQRGFLGRVGLS